VGKDDLARGVSNNGGYDENNRGPADWGQGRKPPLMAVKSKDGVMEPFSLDDLAGTELDVCGPRHVRVLHHSLEQQCTAMAIRFIVD
jgi:hypothetical protein